MMLRTALVVALLTLVGVGAAPVSAADVTGQIIRIERVEPEQHLIVFSDGRTYRLPSTTVVHVDGRVVALGALTPGQTVVIRSGQAVEIQNRPAVTVSPGQAPAPGAPSATSAPGPTVVVAPPATTPPGVRQTLYGRVDDVDDDGTVKIATGRDSFKVTLSRDLVRQIREGDTVQLDMSIVPAGAPATSPR